MQASFGVPAPAGNRKHLTEISWKAGKVGLPDRRRRRCWVKINRNGQMGGRLEDRQEPRIVKKQATRGAIDEHPLESQMSYAPPQLERCGGWLVQSKSSETAETSWVGTHSLGKFIIDVAREGARDVGLLLIETDCGEGQNLEIDRLLVHGGDTTGAKVKELRFKLRNVRWNIVAPDYSGAQKRLGDEVFFKGDRTHAHLAELPACDAVRIGRRT